MITWTRGEKEKTRRGAVLVKERGKGTQKGEKVYKENPDGVLERTHNRIDVRGGCP